MLHAMMKLPGHIRLTKPLIRGNMHDVNLCYLMTFGSLIMSEFYLKMYLSGLVSGWPKSKWLDEAFLGLIQPLHVDDKKGKETGSSQKTVVLGISPILFFSNRVSTAQEQIETQAETKNLNYKVVLKYSTPHSGQPELSCSPCVQRASYLKG